VRAETGAMQFDDDWRGVFIRGDNATAYAMYLRTFASIKPEYQGLFDGLIALLESSDERNGNPDTQKMKTFEQSKRPE
jgi:hypothetical protein